MMKRIVIMSLAAIFCLAGKGFCADPREEQVTPRSTKLLYLEPHQTVLDAGKFKFMAAFTAGYDNNTHLDSNRTDDLYSQQFFKATFESPLSRKTRIEASYEIMSLLYADESDLDLLRNSVSFGIEHSLNSKVTVSTGLNLDAVNYVNYGHDDYYEPDVFVKVRQSLPDKFYHSLAYDLAYQTYPTWLTATVEGPESDEKRADFRNTFLYEVGKYFEKDLAKVYFEFFRNTSNVRFLDYYNYQSYKLGSSLTHIFNDKIMGYLSGYWQCRPFSGRTLINDAGRHERDYTYVLSAAGYYTLNRSTTVGLSYAYRQNNSNEPTEKYSGSLISATAYYRF